MGTRAEFALPDVFQSPAEGSRSLGVSRSIAVGAVRDLLRGLQLGILVMAKPSEGYAQIQDKSRFLYGLLPLVLFFASDAAGLYLTGFAYQTQDPSQVNIALELVRVILPWATWTVAHWAIESVFFGEASLRQIFAASGACLTPMFFFSPVIILMSNVLTSGESGTYYFLQSITVAWTLGLFLLQVKVLNDFSWGRTALVTFLSLTMVLVIWVTFILVYVLTSQVIGFGGDVWYEFQTLR